MECFQNYVCLSLENIRRGSRLHWRSSSKKAAFHGLRNQNGQIMAVWVMLCNELEFTTNFKDSYKFNGWKNISSSNAHQAFRKYGRTGNSKYIYYNTKKRVHNGHLILKGNRSHEMLSIINSLNIYLNDLAVSLIFSVYYYFLTFWLLIQKQGRIYIHLLAFALLVTDSFKNLVFL